ncbi:MAG: isoprenylcysteine carboxylmethyltransferase family protein [Gemmatimonadaceae bacterium]
MNTYAYPVAACWFAFVAYWAVSAFSAKRNLAGSGFRRGMYVRLATIVAVIAVLHFTRAGNVAPHAGATPRSGIWAEFFSNALVRWVGVGLCAMGIALAIWARTIIGKNWGMPMSLKEDPELVTSGPYAHIRHPIYTGMLFAMLGSGLAISPIVLLPFLVFGAYFIYSAIKEEEAMTKQFPDVYPDYRRRTNMLIPFLL